MTVIVAFKHKLSGSFMARMKQKLIKAWTRSNYYHVEIIIDNYWIQADNDIGVVRHKLRPFSKKYDYIEVAFSGSETQEEEVKCFVDSQIGAKYDWLGIYFSQIIKLGINKKDRWFCSELVSRVLQLCDIKPFLGVTNNEMAPGDVYNLLTRECDIRRVVI
jgi:hypothetical protein